MGSWGTHQPPSACRSPHRRMLAAIDVAIAMSRPTYHRSRGSRPIEVRRGRNCGLPASVWLTPALDTRWGARGTLSPCPRRPQGALRSRPGVDLCRQRSRSGHVPGDRAPRPRPRRRRRQRGRPPPRDTTTPTRRASPDHQPQTPMKPAPPDSVLARYGHPVQTG